MIVYYSNELIIKRHTGKEIDPVAGLNEEDDETWYFELNSVPCNPNRINCRRIVNSGLSSSSSESVEVHSNFAHAKVLKVLHRVQEEPEEPWSDVEETGRKVLQHE